MFYETSGGGVTFSGGEPLLHIEYIRDVVSILNKEKIDITITTSGAFDFKKFKEKLSDSVSLLLFDIKIFDNQEHISHTAFPNTLILDNLSRILSNTQIETIIRTPLIPKITDTKKNLSEISFFLKDMRIKQHILLPFNRGGDAKRDSLVHSDVNSFASL